MVSKNNASIYHKRVQDDDDDDWFPEDLHEAFKELRERKVFDVSDMYTIADAWGWTWEKDLKNKAPRRWSQEWEVELAVKLMTKVILFLFCIVDFHIACYGIISEKLNFHFFFFNNFVALFIAFWTLP